MKLTELEGTPAELAEYKLLIETAERERPAVNDLPRPKEPLKLTESGELPQKLVAFIDAHLGAGADREYILDALRGALRAGPEIEAQVGSSTKTADGLSTYVTLVRRKSGVGALSYLEPQNGGSTHRVPLTEVRAPSVARSVKDDDPYKVNVGVTSEAGVAEFVRLVGCAYELAKR
jgi:hypothetical protein